VRAGQVLEQFPLADLLDLIAVAVFVLSEDAEGHAGHPHQGRHVAGERHSAPRRPAVPIDLVLGETCTPLWGNQG
jgi:hypothetical protein